MNEFALIKKLFTPLSANFPGALGLTDDAALISPPDNMQLVITTDMLHETIHFIGNESPADIARKLVRRNLSDLAAMGAEPYCCFLGLGVPSTRGKAWLESFAEGLTEDLQKFAFPLSGGDTGNSKTHISLSLTACGLVPTGQALRRNGAQIGDDIYVSGTIGDAALGLKILRGEFPPHSFLKQDDFLKQRYLIPQPRLELGKKLREIANSCIDISDGLLQDLQHICTTSHCSATINYEKIPFSRPLPPELKSELISAGDDYELLFTAPTEKSAEILALGENITCIGKIIVGEFVAPSGYQHKF